MAITTEKPSIKIVRKFKASPEKVWSALTQPETLKLWMGPTDELKCPVAETDVRVGGRYHIGMQAPDGQMHDVSGAYRKVVVNRKLLYTWAWKSTPERESLVTLELRPVDGGTELTLVHEQFFDAEARDQHEQGWNGCLARLVQSLRHAGARGHQRTGHSTRTAAADRITAG
ncbi:MAG: SRPBCC domain-containing protein [Pseudomonadota bacterium]